MTGKEEQKAAISPTAGKKTDNSENAEKPSGTQQAKQQQDQDQHIDGDANRVDLGPPSSTEEDAARTAEAAAEEAGNGNGRPKLPRPTGIQPCPRCSSIETKFCYYNNYNIKQPRYYCKGCQRYWTAGGTLRDVPVGAGRRRTKGTRSQDDTLSGGGGFSSGSLPYVDPTMAAISLAAAAVAKPNGLLAPMMAPMIPPVIPGMIPPAVIPTLPFPVPAIDFSQLAAVVANAGGAGAAAAGGGGAESLTKATANALLTDPATAAAALGLLQQHHSGAIASKTNNITTNGNQRPQISEVSEDGAVEGRSTKRIKTDDGAVNTAAAAAENGNNAVPANKKHNSNNTSAKSKFSAGSGGVNGGSPMHMPPYSMDWFAAQQNTQAAVAMQAQLQAAAAAAAAGYMAPPPPYAVPGYGYAGFPPVGWAHPAATAAMYQAAAGTSSGRAVTNGNGTAAQQELPVQPPAAALPWMAAPHWPSMVMPPYGVAMPTAFMPAMPPPPAAVAAAMAAPAPSVNKTNNKNDNNNKNGPSGDAK
jgi:hypothetical protein